MGKLAAWGALAIFAVPSFGPQTAAQAAPCWTGATAAEKRLEGPVLPGEVANDQSYEPVRSLVLVDLARFIIENMPAHGLTFIEDMSPLHAGINIPWLVLQASSPLKMPGTKNASEEKQSQSVPTIEAPALRMPELSKLEENKPVSGVFAQEENAPKLQIDDIANPGRWVKPKSSLAPKPRRELAFISTISQANAINEKSKEGLVWLANTSLSFFPPPGAKAPHAANFAFLLWTDYPKSIRQDCRPALERPFSGSFIECAPDVRFASIEGRTFKITKGKLLASAKGEKLVLQAGLAEITLKDGAAALVDFSDGGVLTVLALHAGLGLSVKDGANMPAECKLEAGQGLIFPFVDAAQPISNDWGGNLLKLSAKEGRVGHFAFSLPDLLARDELFKENKWPEDSAKAEALKDLSQRIAGLNASK